MAIDHDGPDPKEHPMSQPTFDLLDNSPEPRSSRLTGLAVTSTVVLLIAGSFVLGRVTSGPDNGIGQARPAATVSAVPSEQAAAAARAEAALARAAEARRAGVRIAPPASAAANLLSVCPQR